MWALAGLGAIEPDDVLAALEDPDPRVRVHALRLAEPLCRDVVPIRLRMLQMVGDADAIVRYQLAFSLGALTGPQPSAALVALAIRDGSDPWMRVAILSSATVCTGSLFEGLVGDAGFRNSSAGHTLLINLVGQTGAAERADDLARILRALDGPLAMDEALSRSVVLALMGTDSASVRALLSVERGGRIRSILDALLTDARTTAVDSGKPPAARALAIRALRFASLSETQGLLTGLLAARQPTAVQAEAIETLSRYDDMDVPAILIGGWREMTPRLRATAVEALFARGAWVGAFLDAVEKGKIGRGDVEPARLELLRSYPDPAIRDRVARVFAAAQTRRPDVVAAYQQALQMKGDAGRGKDVFKARCSSCHRLEGVGQPVGADLSAIRDRGMDAVLLNILDPNREVMPQFLSYVLVTTNGRVLTGMISVETTNSLTIRQPDGHEETVLRLQIEELRSTGLSYMPEGLENQIDVPAMADLLAYLNTAK